jgi:hypothetical protein
VVTKQTKKDLTKQQSMSITSKGVQTISHTNDIIHKSSSSNPSKESFSSNVNHKNSLSCFYTNSRSLRNKKKEFEHYVSTY